LDFSTADKFGRKFNLWALTGFLLIVRDQASLCAVTLTETYPDMKGNILEIVAKEWRLWLIAKRESGRFTR